MRAILNCSVVYLYFLYISASCILRDDTLCWRHVQQTCHTLIAGVHVGNEVLATRMNFEQLRRRDWNDAPLPGGTARRQVVKYVSRTSDVVVVRYAASDAHTSVVRRGDEDHFIVSACRVEVFPLAVFLARRCNRNEIAPVHSQFSVTVFSFHFQFHFYGDLKRKIIVWPCAGAFFPQGPYRPIGAYV